MKNWYDELKLTAKTASRDTSDMSQVTQYSTGMDGFLSDLPVNPSELDLLYKDRRATPVKAERVRVASVDNLKGFTRIASDTLIRHAEKDLWQIKEGEDGEFIIERLFDDDGNPLKV